MPARPSQDRRLLRLLGVAQARQSALWIMPGMASLALFAYLLTLVDAVAAGRVYAAYGGVYIVASILCLWLVENSRPDRWDVTEAITCLVGAAVILVPTRA